MQEGYSNDSVPAGDIGATVNPLTRVLEGSPRLDTLASASSGELSTTSSRALLGSFRNSS